MTMTKQKLARLLCFLGAVLLASGCGPTFVKVRGNVIKDGAPPELKKGEKFQITFQPIDETGKKAGDPFAASAKPQQTEFYVVGRSGKGIPPGRYRVDVAMVRGASEADQFGGRYSKEKSPFIYEVKKGMEDITLDLGSPSP